jgi:hypothetical protein
VSLEQSVVRVRWILRIDQDHRETEVRIARRVCIGCRVVSLEISIGPAIWQSGLHLVTR